MAGTLTTVIGAVAGAGMAAWTDTGKRWDWKNPDKNRRSPG